MTRDLTRNVIHKFGAVRTERAGLKFDLMTFVKVKRSGKSRKEAA